MSSFMSSFIILIAVLVGATVVVAFLSVAQLRIYGERRAHARKEEVAEQVKKQLADLRNSPPPQQKRVDQGNNDVEDTGHEAGQRANESTGEPVSRAQGTVGQDSYQTRATEAEPWATFHLGSIFDRQGEYDRAVEAYQRVIASEHAEAAPRAAFNLGILFEERGEYARAEEAYQQAIDSEHSEWAPKAAFDLGMLSEEREEYDLAVEAYQRAIASGHPEEAPRAAFNLGLMLDKLGEYDRAEEAYQQAINSGHPEVAPKAMGNLRGLPMRFPERIRQG
jgi:tetratricopeptide (TPR) repeat protein